ncbi:MAG: phenylalanine--tRNA ligase subunit beta [Rhodospirillaceae bacterium]|nr:phenylalanine--tRNA ligase subunit beta [Rhodospirillaceae bacterium]
MKFTLSWLKEHLDTDAPLEAIVERLTTLGLEVDEVTDRGAALAPFTIARVISAEPHPNADKLRVCTVDAGAGPVQVVCGAPNARTGMVGVFAAPGSYIPGTDLTLKPGVIRGVESNGMLLSEREMGLSDEHSGIVDLPADAPVGTAYVDWAGLSDPVIDVDLTPDRADCAGVRGIARDLAAAGLGLLKPLAADPVPGRFASPIGVTLDFPEEAANACPLYVGRLIRGVTNGPSPHWLQERLLAIGLRPISALVDITNFFTVDRNRPLHVFDADKVRGGLTIRLSRPGESMEALNDKTYTLDDSITVIADEDGIDGLGGIMGGTHSGVTGATTDVYVESAYFDPTRTALSGRKLQVQSDARYRFERGIDPDAVISGMEQATAMILDLCGGEPSELVIAGAVPKWQRTLTLRPDRVATLGGVDVPLDRQQQILDALGFIVAEGADGTLAVMPPSWRGDVEGEADLVEEILRINGFDQIPATPLPRASVVTRTAIGEARRIATVARRVLANRGLDEAVTWSFMDGTTAAAFGQTDAAMALVNPIASDLNVMRPSILPNLIRAAGRNADRGYPGAALCEVGPVYADPTPKGQRAVAAGVRHAVTGPRHWAAPGRAVDVFDARADAMAVLEAAGAPVANLQITADAPAWYHPGRSGCLRLGPSVLAQFGEVHPGTLKALDVAGPVAAFEVFLDAVPKPKKKGGTARPLLALSAFQPVRRDFAFVVDADVPADKLVRAAKGADRNLIAEVAVFDVYRGPGVPEGKKSLAIEVTLQPVDATLTDAQIEAVGKAVVANVAKQTGGELRG